MIELDLHGLRHDSAIKTVENFIVGESKYNSFQARLITGNSSVLQKKLIDEVLNPLGFDWTIPSNNLGEIIVTYIKL
jgi:hypothetical protein